MAIAAPGQWTRRTGAAPLVRSVDLGDPRWDVEVASTVLTEGERARAARGTPAVRRRRILVRAGLRRVLAELLDVPATAVEIRSDQGRPVLPATDLQVSCSASGEVALLAVARGCVGVDVQRHREEDVRDAAEEGWLAAAESAAIAALPENERAEAVTRAWTQKEAVLKARGTGMRRPPVDVVTPGSPRGVVGSLHLMPVPVRPGYVASLAVGPEPVTLPLDPLPLLPGGAR